MIEPAGNASADPKSCVPSGSSTPTVFDGKLFLTIPIDEKDSVLCFDLKGEKLWEKVLGKDRKGQRVHKNGSTSNPSPVVDADHVYVYFQSGRLAALTHAGEKKWETNLQERWGEDTLWWPLGSSPVLAGANVVVPVIHEGDSYLAAFDRKTGKVVGSIGHNYACCRFTLSEPYVLGANMDMIDLSKQGKLVSTGPAIDSRECLGAVVSNGRIFYMAQASGFVVSQTYGAASENLPAVWQRP